jgi:hypothetical protein
MKSLPLAIPDKLLLNARNMAETLIGSIKQFSSLNLPMHRLPLNAFLHLLAAITAYQINPIKPKLKLVSTHLLHSLPENSLSGLNSANRAMTVKRRVILRVSGEHRPARGAALLA